MRRWLTWLNCGTDQVFGLPQPPRVPTSDQHPKPPPTDWWTGGQAQPPRAPEVPTSGRYPTSEPPADYPSEAWLLGQLWEARRQLEAGIDRLRAIEERLTP